MRKHPELQNTLASPMPSIRTPFRKDGAIDFDGLDSYIETCLSNGAKALMLTYGDSLYSVLTDAEVADVTKFVVERAAGRAAGRFPGGWERRTGVAVHGLRRDGILLPWLAWACGLQR